MDFMKQIISGVTGHTGVSAVISDACQTIYVASKRLSLLTDNFSISLADIQDIRIKQVCIVDLIRINEAGSTLNAAGAPTIANMILQPYHLLHDWYAKGINHMNDITEKSGASEKFGVFNDAQIAKTQNRMM